jgi:signal transduction histidine kinase
VSATHSPSAEPNQGTNRPTRRLPALAPKTFQGRLTVAFVLLIALTLTLASLLVVNRLDDFFTRQQEADLRLRTDTVAEFVIGVASTAVRVNGIVIDGDGTLNPVIVRTLDAPQTQRLIADRLGQANVRIVFGGLVADGETFEFVPAIDGAFEIPLQVAAALGQTQEQTTVGPETYRGTGVRQAYAVRITLSNPYTFRAAALANVTGLLAAIALFAMGLSVVVAAALTRRFTTPLRRLTDASRALAEGDLTRRVPPQDVRAGSIELAELAVQFNAMADRVEESLDMIRRDRDRSRDFLADVSHELRTPIAALRTFNELLKGHAGGDPDARSEFLESGGEQIERLDWLATNLLELSKLDSGLVLLDLRPDDLRAAVESAVDQAESAARKRSVALTLQLPERPLRIRHDPQRIGQVVSNLVANAIKFTPRGGSVVVTLTPVVDGARIEVVDTGVGIDASEMPHIFERFYRGSQANEARGSGSGLGLAIVRSIVDMHGGTIVVESRIGGGSRFAVTLPADPRLVAGTPAAERADVASAAEAAARAPSIEPAPADLAVKVAETSPSEGSPVNFEAPP